MTAIARIAAWLLALALVALPVVAVLNGWVGAQRWPLKRLRVEGQLERVDPARLRAVLQPFASAGFFAVNLRQARDAVQRVPWVEHAEVRKRWPDVLEVVVIEHHPFARWGSDRLLSREGRLFPLPAGLDASALPRLGGPDARVPEVVALYNESSQLFATAGLKVQDLQMDARGSWSLHLDNGTDVVVGRNDALSRLSRFARLMPRLPGGGRALARADLRYTNGFAVIWQDAPAPRPSAAPARTPTPAAPAARPLPAPLPGGLALRPARPLPFPFLPVHTA